jgi:hypothetical protein
MDASELAATRAHVGDCADCAERLDSVERALSRATPPQVPQVGAEQVDASWHAILDQVATPVQAQRKERTRLLDWLFPSFEGMPQWSWQMAQIVILAGLGFAAAWYLAGQGWLPGTQPLPDVSQRAGTPSIESTRDWLAANGYAEQLEVLLLDLARGDDPSGTALSPTVKEVSRNLLTDARWYRRAADRAGDPVLVDLLSEIEIVLLAVATVPEGQEDDLVATLRDLIDDQNLLWRLRSVRKDEVSAPSREVATFGSSG